MPHLARRRLNKEIRRRLDVIGRHPDETGCLSLIYGFTKKYADQQRGFLTNDLVQALWKKLREEKIAMITQLELDLYPDFDTSKNIILEYHRLGA